jgi:hypothetical protein
MLSYSIYRYANHSAQFIHAYGEGLTGAQAAWANRKYHSHRTLPPDMIRHKEFHSSIRNFTLASPTFPFIFPIKSVLVTPYEMRFVILCNQAWNLTLEFVVQVRVACSWCPLPYSCAYHHTRKYQAGISKKKRKIVYKE